MMNANHFLNLNIDLKRFFTTKTKIQLIIGHNDLFSCMDHRCQSDGKTNNNIKMTEKKFKSRI